MTHSRDIRRCAVQALYQFDAGNGADDVVRASLAESPGDERTHAEGFALARKAWEMKDDADRAVAALAPEWPTHRQPVIDRSILRLAFFEMNSGATPPKVAINEAVELAREFSTDKSPMFVNGVLDKIYKSLQPHTTPGQSDAPASTTHPKPGHSEAPPRVGRAAIDRTS